MIRVLESTLQDVENIFGKADRKNYLIAHYLNLEDGNLTLDYSNGNCPSMLNLGWNVPKETVVRIIFRPKQSKRFPQLGIDQTKLQRISDENHDIYINRDEGVTYVTDYGWVKSIEYKPTSNQNYLKCFNPEK